MTEIPANTPNPIGSTDSWVPGSWNLAALEVAVSAAEVAVVPDAGVAVEVRVAVLRVVAVRPEVDGHRRVRARAHELAGPARVLDAPAVVVEDLDGHAE